MSDTKIHPDPSPAPRDPHGMIIAVVGATGAQGGGLVRAICANPSAGLRARALTRKPDSDKAKALAELGAEVVAVDIDDRDSVLRAFEGAHGAYCVTNFWEHFSPQREIAQATNMAEAAKAAGVAHVVWSTLEDTRRFIRLDDDRMPTLMGNYKVPHFDAKGEADAAFTRAGVPTTFLLTSFYWDNLLYFGMGPKPDADGQLVFTLPLGDVPLPGIAAQDIGGCAFGLLQAPSEWIGKTVGICGDQLTGEQMAAALGEALGCPVRYQAVPAAVYRSFGFQGAEDLGNMFQFQQEFSRDFCGARSVETSRRLNPQLHGFTSWLAANARHIPL